jgi:very-short-patch-repair endonuclease
VVRAALGLFWLVMESLTTISAQPDAFAGVVAQKRSIDRPDSPTTVRLVGGRVILVVGDTPDIRLAMVGDAQSARISRAQLATIGVTESMVKTRVRAGRLRRVHHGVYAVGHALEVEFGAETAALLAVDSAVALSHRSAASVFGIVPERPSEVDVDVVVVNDGRHSRPGIRVHRSLSLQPVDVTRCRGLPVTAPARVLLELASTRPPREVERALDEALAVRLVTPTKIRAAVARAPGMTGGPLLLALLDPDRALGITRSDAERRLLEVIRMAGLPDPERNVRIGPYEVDCLWRDARLVVEVDSYAWHSGPSVFKSDRRKDAYLVDHGFEVQRVTWEMLEDPLPLVVRLARAIGTGLRARDGMTGGT